ncbi:hypothetical protein Taro_024763 [Colocasia esculenta]|uniref:UDP-N-acetylmuramate dehydrogenase n=1 Tax=Colocasia esculenta TaxID=4460 RepID=A0A843VEL2_COLES|nr:hypothetical protein [Colocasia esculenta]
MLLAITQGNLLPLSPSPLPFPRQASSFRAWGCSARRRSPAPFPICAASEYPTPSAPPRRLTRGFSSSSSSPPPQPDHILPDEEEMEEADIGMWIGEGNGEGRGQKKKHLSELSSWGIGGPCRYFLEASSPSQLISAVRYCRARSVPFLIVGKGSNCLFDDRGFDGCVILNRLNSTERTGPGAYRVGSGYPFNRLGVECSRDGYSGLEFAGGVPGTVGGAAFMNAGANGQETSDCIESVQISTTQGWVRVLDRDDLTFGYRRSCFQEMEDLAAILAVTFRLTPSVSALEQQRRFLERRRKSQPLGEKSAGSVFRNPHDSEMSAGQLIEKAGLKGFKLGGAKVSEVHANFFINFDGSTSRDMRGLISLVKEKVHQKFGVELHEEVRYVSYNVIERVR